MYNKHIVSIILAFAALCSTANAQLKKMAISDVKASPGIIKAATANNTVVALERVVQAFDTQLIDRMHNTRKFEVIARSDLKSLLKDADASGAAFKVPSADYVLVTTLDDFQDYKEEMVLPSTGERLSKRVIRVTAVAKIYDGNGKLIESANVTRSVVDAGGKFNSTTNGDLTDALLGAAVNSISSATANRVSDVIFPAKVISKIDKQITINRGDGTDIRAGDVWLVYALGQELRDPDTGEVLERERLLVGKVRVTRVNPKTTLAEIVDDKGIDVGAMLQPEKQ